MSDTTPNSGHIWCSALFAQFSANGVEHAVISPGSRSTPLAVAADQTNSLKTSIHLDERSGSYFALGLAKSTRKPVILICTSGTAAANYLPAVIEAFHAGVPLIVLSADRPPELQERGAPQTIDQTNLYGSHVRAFHQAPVASTSTAGEAIALGATAYFQSLNPITGPVHINCPMREPLEPTGQLPSFFDLIDQTESIQKIELEPIKDLLNHEKGLIIAGPMHYDNKELMQIAKLGASTGWPIIADPASGLRNGTHVKNALVMASGEHILRSLWAIRHRPDVIFQLGKMPTSKGYKIFLNRTGCNNLVSIDDLGFFPDPENLVTHRVNLAPGLLASHLLEAFPKRELTTWTKSWKSAEDTSAEVISKLLNDLDFGEATIARDLGNLIPENGCILVSSSMPIRDLDAFSPISSKFIKIFANRGANGIDGLVSTAAGIAEGSEEVPTILFTGDLAFLHDLSGFTALQRLGSNLTIVIVDNNGGGIFSFLPIAKSESINYKKLFHTPHDLDIGLLAPLVGGTLFQPKNTDEFHSSLKKSIKQLGVHIVHVVVDTDINVETHKTATLLVDEALG